ncbi:MAG TPA: tRNA (adenosine(37)-N6)-threonylcarbamoyltransferase complex transferase subunit TsaD [Terriglobales bacterium]|nr:tRNA (adenosine(37)-N6)-threonylcarbamoyltransferase complex transferase subunit TsaD [Terriglobales bacterium]
MIVLGIESSCDETAAAIVDSERQIRANLILSQLDEHRPFGGVVPEVAARSHLDHLDKLIAAAMQEAGLGYDQLNGIAATGGPGLIGGVIVGAMTGKAIAAVHKKPFIAVNHLEGHALTARLTDNVAFPYLLLLVSGGHCQLLIVEGVGLYRRLGATIDDAVGEAFDKAAKLLGLGYPGGPAVERAAAQAQAPVTDLPRPMKGRADCNFSFSGLKTALRQRVDSRRAAGTFDEAAQADLAAGFQMAAIDTLCDRTAQAARIARDLAPGLSALVVAGGVAANLALRTRLQAIAEAAGLAFVAPPGRLCTDNAAMIAWAGLERLRLGESSSLDFAPRPRWPLDQNAPGLSGAGVKA